MTAGIQARGNKRTTGSQLLFLARSPNNSSDRFFIPETAQVELPADRIHSLGELSGYYIQSRYPEEIKGLASTMSQETADATLKATEETTQWVFSMLE
jgi:HEPN domain-containing protein